MPKLFNAEELHHLRNDLAIEALLRALKIPTRQRAMELLRFECPRCFSYHTAIHPTANLARCFNCRQNFNPIELTMLVKHLSFVEAVRLLQRNEAKLNKIKDSPPQLRQAPSATPTSIAEVLRQIAFATRQP